MYFAFELDSGTGHTATRSMDDDFDVTVSFDETTGDSINRGHSLYRR